MRNIYFLLRNHKRTTPTVRGWGRWGVTKMTMLSLSWYIQLNRLLDKGGAGGPKIGPNHRTFMVPKNNENRFEVAPNWIPCTYYTAFYKNWNLSTSNNSNSTVNNLAKIFTDAVIIAK